MLIKIILLNSFVNITEIIVNKRDGIKILINMQGRILITLMKEIYKQGRGYQIIVLQQSLQVFQIFLVLYIMMHYI